MDQGEEEGGGVEWDVWGLGCVDQLYRDDQHKYSRLISLQQKEGSYEVDLTTRFVTYQNQDPSRNIPV